jgi:CheY-like chemotaxis protein
MSKLFHSFSQVDASTTRNYGGTGLGLAISRKLVDMMNGTMWVESKVNEGTTFFFTIDAEAITTKSKVYFRGQNPVLYGKKVLIVDDNLTNRKILSAQTELWGMTPAICSYPKEAIKLINNGEKFDLAILDYAMPEMDGLELTREIRSLFSVTSLPIIILTSVGKRENLPEVKDLNISAFLSKPIKQKQLYDNILSVLGEKVKSPSRRKMKPFQVADNLADRYPMKILVAEDNVVNQKVAQRILERVGYRADVVANGYEAVEVSNKIRYDLIFMDLLMPEMDGLTAAKIIRGRTTNNCCPKIIAMTANAMKEDKDRCLAAGLDDFISKPIRTEDLQSILINWGERINTGNSSTQIPIREVVEEKIINESDILFIKDIQSSSDAVFFGELLDAYIQELPSMIHQIDDASKNKDCKNLYFYSHKLKGSSLTLGIKPIAVDCEEIESLAKAENLNGRVTELSENLVKKFKPVIEELEVIKEKYTKFPV